MFRTITYCASVAAFATVALASADAFACGGFFCNGGNAQVNQAAERIVFAEHPDGQVTAVIQIMYDGPTDRFGWLLPVPGIPEVGLSSDAAFVALQNATNPQYTMNVTVEGECRVDERVFDAQASGNNNSAPANNTTGGGGGVTVLDSGNAGPYDFVVIQIDGAAGDKATLALDWLETNNYEVTDVGPELLGPYLDENYNLLAIRLQKSADSGSVRPIRLTYDDDHPMIPIKLTAVAANEDMGVMTWVLGANRAVPVNYKALELNDALLNWFNPSSNYNDVVIAAANEASGQGFVTEYAQETSALGQVIYTDNDADNWDFVNNTDWTGNEWELVVNATDRFGSFGNSGGFTLWDGMVEAFDAALPTLTAEQREQLSSCGVYCAFQDQQLPADFDAAAFIAALDEFVVAPMRETQELFDDFAHVTRLYTTMSAAEMTLDPSFDFNPDLEDVSNIHTAERIIECGPSVYQFEAPWRAELPSGLLVRGVGNSWPIVQDDMMPATLTVSEVGTSGQGTVVRDNLETVKQRLEVENAKVPGPDNLGTNVGKSDVGGGACSTTSGTSISPFWLLLGFVLLRRRSR